MPTTIRVSDQGQVRVEVRIGKLTDPGSVNDNLFTHPIHAQEWATCEKPIHETYAAKVPPSYPEHERQSHHEGTVVMYDIIAADGSIEMLKVIESAGPLFDEAAMNAVRQWKYNPAVCDGVPIRKESEVQVNFALSR
jgi:TonB family protein